MTSNVVKYFNDSLLDKLGNILLLPSTQEQMNLKLENFNVDNEKWKL